MTKDDLDELESWARDIETRFMLDSTLALQAVAELRQVSSNGDTDNNSTEQPGKGAGKEPTGALCTHLGTLMEVHHYPPGNRQRCQCGKFNTDRENTK